MSDSMNTYRAWLDALPDTDGFSWISEPRAFAHDDCRYEHVAANCRTVTALLVDGVPVLFHDFLNSENDTGEYGVRQAALEWAAAGHVRFIGTSGCSGLFVKTSPGANVI